jgi:prepilin-type N-terminal cleavage/methylation domain-containing protein
MRRGLLRRDAGFTLVELLVVIAIMGVVTVPVANFVIGYFRNSTQAAQRLSVSHDIQIASAYFSQDVANTGLRMGTSYTPAQSVWVNSAAAVRNGSWQCRGAVEVGQLGRHRRHRDPDHRALPMSSSPVHYTA